MLICPANRGNRGFPCFRCLPLDRIAFGGVHGYHEFANGGEIGLRVSALDAIERFRPNTVCAVRQFHLREPRGPATPTKFFRQRSAIDVESRRRGFLLRCSILALQPRFWQSMSKTVSRTIT